MKKMQKMQKMKKTKKGKHLFGQMRKQHTEQRPLRVVLRCSDLALASRSRSDPTWSRSADTFICLSNRSRASSTVGANDPSAMDGNRRSYKIGS